MPSPQLPSQREPFVDFETGLVTRAWHAWLRTVTTDLGDAILGLVAIPNAVLVTDALGDPAYSTTLPAVSGANLTNLNASALTSGLVAVARGGTGIGAYAIGDLLYADGATSLARLADVATGNALISGGIGAAPAWGKIGLTTHVSGDLPFANLVQASAASRLVGRGSASGAGDFEEITLGSGLTMSGTALSVASSVGVNALLDGANHSDTLAGAVVRGDLVVGNSTPKWARFAIGAANSVLTANGTDPAWSTTPTVASVTTTGNATIGGSLTVNQSIASTFTASTGNASIIVSSTAANGLATMELIANAGGSTFIDWTVAGTDYLARIARGGGANEAFVFTQTGTGGFAFLGGAITGSFENVGLSVYDTDASHLLTIAAGSNLTANRTLFFATGDADRTISLGGNPTLADWFDQGVKSTSNPTFAGASFTGQISATNVGLIDSDLSHSLRLTAGSNLTADRVFTIITGDAARTITLSGNPTIADWFDQSVKVAASPTFANVAVTGNYTGGNFSGTFGGNPTLSGTVTIGTLTVSSGGTLSGTFGGNPTLSGTVTIGTLTVSSGGTMSGTFGGNPTFSGAVTIASGTLSGTFGGNPTFSGAVSIGTSLSLAATARLYLDGGSNTYITEVSADVQQFVAGGAERFRVANNLVAVPATIGFYLDGGGDTFLKEDVANQLQIVTGGTERIVVNSTGVGIGVSPAVALHVENAGGPSVRLKRTAFAGSLDLSADGSAVYVDSAGAALPILFRPNQVEQMRITSGGNVGIGVTPSYKLHVSGTQLYLTSTSNTELMTTNSGGGATVTGGIQALTAQSIRVGSTTAYPTELVYNNTAYFTVGNALLTAGAPIVGPNGSAGAPTFAASGDTNTGFYFDGSDGLFVTTGGTARFAIGSGGNIGVAAAARLYFDGTALSGDTYLQESSANTLDIVAGGALSVRLTAGSVGLNSPLTFLNPINVSFTGTQNDYTPSGWAGSNIVHLSGSSTPVITGFAAGAAGETKVLINVGATAISISYEGGGSAAANRVRNQHLTAMSLSQYEMTWLVYSGNLSRWVVMVPTI